MSSIAEQRAGEQRVEDQLHCDLGHWRLWESDADRFWDVTDSVREVQSME